MIPTDQSGLVYIGLGSNEGDREANLVAGLRALAHIDAVSVAACSSLYESAPSAATRCASRSPSFEPRPM